MNKLHLRCPQFGWGCDRTDDFCGACKDKYECLDLSIKEKDLKATGHKPKIPKATDPNMNVAGVSRPHITDRPWITHSSLPPNTKKKISFTVWLDFDWFKKQLGSDYFGEDVKK